MIDPITQAEDGQRLARHLSQLARPFSEGQRLAHYKYYTRLTRVQGLISVSSLFLDQ